MHALLAKINAHVGYSNKTPIKNLFEYAFTKDSSTRRPDIWERIKDMDLDQAFKKIAANMFRRNPFNIDQETRDDLIIDALNNVLQSPAALKSYDVNQDFFGYFGRIFQLKLTTELQELTRRYNTEKDNFDDTNMTNEERFDLMGDTEDHSNDLENYVQLKQLLLGLDKHLKSNPKTSKLAPLLPMLMQGESSKDIAEALGISAGAVSQYLALLKESIAEYAKKTKNQLLLTLVEELAGKRRHADTETKPFETLFHLYERKKTHTEAEALEFPMEDFHSPVGNISRIQIKHFEDPFSEEQQLTAANNPTTSQAEMDAQIEALVKELTEGADVLDDGENRISVLRIVP